MHVKDDVNLHILHMFEGSFSLEVAQIKEAVNQYTSNKVNDLKFSIVENYLLNDLKILNSGFFTKSESLKFL